MLHSQSVTPPTVQQARMLNATSDWLERQADRELSGQQSQVETAKLLSTFACGIGAAIVATALQVGRPCQLDLIATALLGIAVMLAVLTIVRDRVADPDPDGTLRSAAHHGWDDSTTLAKLRELTDAVVIFNSRGVRRVQVAAFAAVIFSAASGVLGSVSLLS